MARRQHHPDKDYQKLIAVAEADGWEFGQRGGGHPFVEKDGRKIFFAASPGDRRSIANLRRDFRRYGIAC